MRGYMFILKLNPKVDKLLYNNEHVNLLRNDRHNSNKFLRGNTIVLSENPRKKNPLP